MSLVIYHDTYLCTSQSGSCVPASASTFQSGTHIKKIVMLHGWGMNSLVWDDLIPLLIPNYEITIIDLPGMGRSPLPEGEYTIDFLVNKVLEVAPEKAIWFGWSLGSLVVQKIALDFPNRIECGFLIAGTPKFVANESWPLAMPLTVFEKFQSLLAEDWQGTLIRFLTLQCKGSETIKEDTRKLREYLFHYGLPATKALREGLCILKEVDLRSALPTLSVPLKFISGEYDALVPVKVLQDIEKLSPHIDVHIVKGASHAAHISHAKEVAQILFNTFSKTIPEARQESAPESAPERMPDKRSLKNLNEMTS